uniref:Uncharacterized protein n=1 Tax=Arundo donax TaxID=35708 RepID=A0A0A9DQZ5_ARUDO
MHLNRIKKSVMDSTLNQQLLVSTGIKLDKNETDQQQARLLSNLTIYF